MYAPESAEPRPALTVAETCDLLGVTRPTIYEMVKRGELTKYKIGRCTRFNRRQVLALVGEEMPDDGAA